MITNQIYLGDNLEILKSIPNESIDVVFADPPFNLNKKYTSYNDKLHDDEYLELSEKWIIECCRILKPTGSIFIHNIPKWGIKYAHILDKYVYFKHWITWDASTAAAGNTLQPNNYPILFYTKSEKNFKFYKIRSPHKRDKNGNMLKDYGGKPHLIHPYGAMLSDIWNDIHRIRHNKNRDNHPCQLPIHLLERIILMSSDENDIILDPFMGSGTTAIASKKLNRKWIGIEIDENYVKIINSKLENEKFISKINDIYVSLFNKEIITLRDKDWDKIKEYFTIPNNLKIQKSKLNYVWQEN